jgi:hypothetical protein
VAVLRRALQLFIDAGLLLREIHKTANDGWKLEMNEFENCM